LDGHLEKYCATTRVGKNHTKNNNESDNAPNPFYGVFGIFMEKKAHMIIV